MKEKGFFYGDVGESPEMDHVVYGVYEDRALRRPIAENHIKDLMKADIVDEKGKYIYYQPYVYAVLDKGTYYAAAYTTNPFDDFKMEYESLSCYFRLHDTLSDGKPLRFSLKDKKQVNQFKLKDIKSNRIKVTAENGITKVTLCDDKNNIIDAAKFENKESEGKQFAFFKVNKSKSYFLKVRSYYPINEGEEHPFPFVSWLYIKYENV